MIDFMNEFIERRKALEAFCKECPFSGCDGLCRQREAVVAIPAANAVDISDNGLTVIGTPDEINTVMQTSNPNYPRQNLENAGTECSYVIGGVNVTLHVRDMEA